MTKAIRPVLDNRQGERDRFQRLEAERLRTASRRQRQAQIRAGEALYVIPPAPIRPWGGGFTLSEADMLARHVRAEPDHGVDGRGRKRKAEP